MEREELIRRAWQQLEPELQGQGYELVEIEYGQHGARQILRVFVDKEGGVTLDDCAAVSQLLNLLLDTTNLIKGRYVLEVSSPGFDRPIRKLRDFERFTGEKIKAKTYVPVDGRRKFRGTLRAFRDGLVEIDCDGKIYAIHLENLKKANLDR